MRPASGIGKVTRAIEEEGRIGRRKDLMTSTSMPTIMDLVTIAIAFAALVLGGFNTLWNMTRDRVRLYVSANRVMILDPGLVNTLMLNVTNLGTTAVTLDSIHITLKADKRTIQFPGVRTTSGRSFPVRMEPRTAVSIMIPQKTFNDGAIMHGKNVIANTACGRVFGGVKSRRFRKLIRMVQLDATK